MGISPQSVIQNGVTGWLSLSGSTVTVSVSSTSLWWRINGTNSGGDHGTYYIPQTRDDSASFTAEDGHKYAFQVCSSSGNWSNGDFFNVTVDSDDGEGSGNTGSGDAGTGWGYWADDMYFGDKCSVSWMPASLSATYRLEFSIGNYIAKTNPVTPGIDSYYTYRDHEIPLIAAENLPNSTSGIMSVSIIQYSDYGGLYETGYRMTTHFKISLRDNIVPSIESCEATLYNSNSVLTSWGIALAKYSQVKLSASASGVYGSNIVSYTISGDYNTVVGVSESSINLNYIGGIINSSGNKAFTITCTDSRGRTSSARTTNMVSFLSYTEPKINKLAIRKETYSDSNTSNDKMVVDAVWSCDAIQGYNSSYGMIYYKSTSSVDWTLHGGTLTSGTPFTLTGLTLEEYTSYNFRLVVVDAIGSTAKSETFSSTTPVLLDFKAGGNGLGVGKVCEDPGMEVAMDSTFFGEVYIGNKERTLAQYITSISPTFDMIYPVGSIYMSVVGTDPGLLFGGSWQQLPGRFLLGAGGNEANTDNTYGQTGAGALNRPAGERGGEVNHTLTVNEMPSHTHNFFAEIPNAGAAGGYDIYPWYQRGVDANYANAVKASGGNAAHNNMPPYLVVYMWKRVA